MFPQKQKKFEVKMKVYLATLPNDYFGNSSQSWLSIDVDLIKNYLVDKGFVVDIVKITDLFNINFDKNDYVFYCSFDNIEIASYIKDLMYFVAKKVKIVPNYDLLLCFENKGAQELYKKHYNFGDLKGDYFFDINDFDNNYPKVFKTNSGAGSTGVYLIKNESQLLKIKNKFFVPSLKRKLIKIQRKMKLDEEQYKIYDYRYNKYMPYVIQDFIPSLDRDYKILIFGSKYYILTRFVRKNDFRASGSGNFKFIEVSNELLEFAKNCFQHLDVPYASLDIAEKDGKFYLIEFQATNFGPYTLCESPWYYTFNNCWELIKSKSELSQSFAESFEWYLNNV